MMLMLSTVVLLLSAVLVNRTWSLSSSEYTALYDLYKGTGGKFWKWKAPSPTNAIWNFTSTTLSQSDNICTQNWQGVKCNSLNCQQQKCFIVELVLPKYGLKGILPTSLKGLTGLVVLDISYNNLSTHSLTHLLIYSLILPRS